MARSTGACLLGVVAVYGARGARPGGRRLASRCGGRHQRARVGLRFSDRGSEDLLVKEKQLDTHFRPLESDVPGSAWSLGTGVFNRELGQLILALQGTPLAGFADFLREVCPGVDLRPSQTPPKILDALTLQIEKVVERERERGVPESSELVKGIFFVLCFTLDRLYEGRPIPKFWVLETVARLPYFSFTSVLHLYESLGWWRTPQLRDIHNAEENNELHHLLIMESLGGNNEWFDRFVALHAAIAYYWVVVVLFVVQPSLAYNFSHLVEEHAYVTYAQFVEENEELLRGIPPPPIAREYYVNGDLYYFDKFQTSRSEDSKPRRRPPCDNMLDVFINIRDDEFEHILTMSACEKWWAGEGPTPVPSSEQSSLGKRADWVQWSEEVNNLEPKAIRSNSGP